MGLSSSTVCRRIDRLEYILEVELFHRLPEGVMLTAEGQTIAQSVRHMHRSLCDFERTRDGQGEAHRPEITIAVTEGLGSYWIMPRLVEFQQDNPRAIINLYCAMESVDVLRLEADFAIQFIKPTSPDLIAAKLGRLHIYPFASLSYLRTYGTPRNVRDMVNHRLVEQVAPQIDNSALARYLGLASTKDIVGVRTNTSTAHLYAIEKGAGVGGLPTFAAVLGAPVVPVDIGDGYSLDIWLTFHPDVRNSAHKSRTISWIKSMFDPETYPWFRDQLIHPRALAEMAPSQASINDGQGYLAVEQSPMSQLLRRRT
jgi:DNA-binding transcriptional LysR family regulator